MHNEEIIALIKEKEAKKNKLSKEINTLKNELDLVQEVNMADIEKIFTDEDAIVHNILVFVSKVD